MAKHLTHQPLIIQDENSNIIGKKSVGDSKLKSFGGATKKGKAGAKDRKALNDITNKSLLPNKTLSKKKGSQKEKEEFKIAEEGFLHDHNKCIAAQKAMGRPNILDTVLPGHNGLWNTIAGKSDAKIESPRYYPEPVEMPMFDWEKPSITWKSPPSSPIPVLVDSPFSWEHETVEFMLKEDELC